MSLSKADKIWIISRRNIGKTMASLWREKNDVLDKYCAEITDEELAALEQQRELRKTYINGVEDTALTNGIAISGKSKEGLADMLSQMTLCEKIDLDEDQQAVISKLDQPNIYISAGPGAGKTTLLSTIVTHLLQKNKNLRILILAYNVNAEATFIDKCKRQGIKNISRKHIRDANTKGCFILTFNKFAWWINPSTHDELSYNVSLTACLQHNFGKWDYFIVDEAQDLLSDHVAIIDKCRKTSQHFIVAGDPRQEIYTSANWFSTLWSSLKESERSVLTYNHRSTPEVVEFLNKFSRKHFPTLHIEQKSSRPSDGSSNVHSVIIHPRMIPINCAEILAGSESGSACIISPVTIEKFGNEDLFTSIRQRLHEIKIEAHLMMINNENEKIMTNMFYAGNSYRLKGTEKSNVILVSSDVPYTRYGISWTTVVKLIFVAISRARDNLIIFCSSVPGDLWGDLIDFPVKIDKAPVAEELGFLETVQVKSDLSKCFDNNSIFSSKTIPKLPIEGISDPDFCGIFVEACLATALKNTLTIDKIRCAEIKKGRLIEATGVFQTDTGYELVFDPRRDKDLSTKIYNLYEQEKTHPEYAYAVVKMSANCGTIWTVSERFEKAKYDCSQYLKFLPSPLFHNRKIEHKINAMRSDIFVGRIVGEVDFLNEKYVVECKHGKDLESYISQVAIYGSILKKRPICINTKTGTVKEVYPIRIGKIERMARSILILKQSCIIAQRIQKRIRRQLKSSTIISVDIENLHDTIYEIGAVAFVLGSFRVLDTFWVIADGVSETAQKDKADESKSRLEHLLEETTGLHIISKEKIIASQESIIAQFHAWASRLGSPVFLHWAGQDAQKCRWTGETLDASTLFRGWSESIGQKRESHYTLSDAVEMFFSPKFPFAPHRAFEDAAMTAGICNILVNSDGTL